MSLHCLLENDSIVNKTRSTGLASFFVKDGSNNDVFESSQEDGDQNNDSFLCFLDSVETPTKEQSHLSNHAMRNRSTEKITRHHNRKDNIKRATDQGAFPYSPSTTITNEKLQPLKVDQKTLKEKDISHTSCQMASTIYNLSNSLQMERSKSDKLLLENFKIKVRNKYLECEIQRLLCSPNTKIPLSESNNIENKTNSATGVRNTSPVASNDIAHTCNTASTSKQRIASTAMQQMQGPSANVTKNNTRKRHRTTRKNGTETKSQLQKKVKEIRISLMVKRKANK